MDGSAGAGPAGHGRPLASRRIPWMLAPSLAAAARTTMHRFTTSSPDSTLGHGKPSLGRAADPRRVTEARNRRLKTHGVAVHPRPNEGTVADLAYVPREPLRRLAVRVDGDVIVRAGRSRYRRRLCLPFRAAPRSRDRRSRLQLVGVCRLASLTPTPVSGPACQQGPPPRPHPHTSQFWQGPAQVVRGRIWRECVRVRVLRPEVPSRRMAS